VVHAGPVLESVISQTQFLHRCLFKKQAVCMQHAVTKQLQAEQVGRRISAGVFVAWYGTSRRMGCMDSDCRLVM
jgi:hypothetical protein